MPSGPATSDYATPIQDESLQKAPAGRPLKVSKGQRGWRTRKLKEKAIQTIAKEKEKS